jgi:hypothetical protein
MLSDFIKALVTGLLAFGISVAFRAYYGEPLIGDPIRAVVLVAAVTAASFWVHRRQRAKSAP